MVCQLAQKVASHVNMYCSMLSQPFTALDLCRTKSLDFGDALHRTKCWVATQMFPRQGGYHVLLQNAVKLNRRSETDDLYDHGIARAFLHPSIPPPLGGVCFFPWQAAVITIARLCTRLLGASKSCARNIRSMRALCRYCSACTPSTSLEPTSHIGGHFRAQCTKRKPQGVAKNQATAKEPGSRSCHDRSTYAAIHINMQE